MRIKDVVTFRIHEHYGHSILLSGLRASLRCLLSSTFSYCLEDALGKMNNDMDRAPTPIRDRRRFQPRLKSKNNKGESEQGEPVQFADVQVPDDIKEDETNRKVLVAIPGINLCLLGQRSA